MQIPFYQIDAFTDKAFGGNPAAVCILEDWLEDHTLQNIAVENNLAETAFLIKTPLSDCDYSLRWFTPGCEVDLCGHATLAAAKVLFDHYEKSAKALSFSSRSGPLHVMRYGDKLELDFPVDPNIRRIDALPAGAVEALGKAPDVIMLGVRDHLLVYKDQTTVTALKPDFHALKAVGHNGFVATALGDDPAIDFVSRCFFPSFNINEDPVTGSAHCLSGPYWSAILGKKTLRARQISDRVGDLWLRLEGERIHIAGYAQDVIKGFFYI